MQKNVKRYEKKGTTLVEVTTALALVAIAMAMIVSFCSLTLSNVLYYQTYDKLKEETVVIESVIDKWVSYYDSSDYAFKSQSNILLADDGENTFSFNIENETLQAQYKGKEGFSYKLKIIKGVTFNLSSNSDGGQLIKFTFNYELMEEKTGEFSIYKAKRSIGGNL